MNSSSVDCVTNVLTVAWLVQSLWPYTWMLNNQWQGEGEGVAATLNTSTWPTRRMNTCACQGNTYLFLTWGGITNTMPSFFSESLNKVWCALTPSPNYCCKDVLSTSLRDVLLPLPACRAGPAAACMNNYYLVSVETMECHVLVKYKTCNAKYIICFEFLNVYLNIYCKWWGCIISSLAKPCNSNV